MCFFVYVGVVDELGDMLYYVEYCVVMLVVIYSSG